MNSFEELDEALEAAKKRSEISFIEVKCFIDIREDLGRSTTAFENKENFMEYVSQL